MTLEEAIKHCEEEAEKQEITAKSNLMEIDKIKADGILRLYDADEYESCMKCASEHRQLAEWLRELKAYREAYEEIKRLPIAWEFGEGVIRCLTIVEDCLEEVKADERV